MNGELKVSKIKHGTVIDHIRAGTAPTVLKILGIDQGASTTVVVAMNVKSQALGLKDIVKIEGKILSESALKKISLIAPQANINIIKDYAVVEKREVSCPHVLKGIVRCPNRNCISIDPTEKVQSHFVCDQEEPLVLRCHYCEVTVPAVKAQII